MEPQIDPLWETAKKRASFRKHLTSYLVMIAFFWALWLMSGRVVNRYERFPWPAWIMFWWGIGLVFSYVKAYHTHGAVEQEYQKLKNQQ